MKVIIAILEGNRCHSRNPGTNTFTKIGLIAAASLHGVFAPLLISPCQTAIAGPAFRDQSTLTQPKAVLDQFYQGYVTRKKTWKDFKDLIDPATYDQLSRVRYLGAEPFTNVQVDIWSYKVGIPSIKGNQAEVPVTVMAGLRRAETPVNLRLVLRKNNDRWQIRNVIYSSKPTQSGEPNDLLSLLKSSKSAK